MKRGQNNPISFESHDFYCMKCGKKGIPLPRNKGRVRKENHIKHLWCLNCRERTPHMECRNEEEKEKMKKLTPPEQGEEFYHENKEKGGNET